MHKIKSKAKPKTAKASAGKVPAAPSVATSVDREKGKAQAAAIFAALAKSPQTKVVLNIANAGSKLPPAIARLGFQEIRFGSEGDGAQVIGDIRDLSYIPDDSCDIVWNANSLCYLYAHEVPAVLRQIHRVLKPKGMFLALVPDMQRLGTELAKGKLEKVLYKSPAGPITAMDMIYGHVASLTQGRRDMEVQSGFTAPTMANKLVRVGFGDVEIRREGFALHINARKVQAVPADKPHVRYVDDDTNKMMRIRDEIDKEPEIWQADLSPLKK